MKVYKCQIGTCNKVFTRKFNLTRHNQRLHSTEYIEKCILCGKLFNSSEKLQKHLLFKHGPSEKFLLNSSAFDKEAQIYRYVYDGNIQNFNEGQQMIFKNLMETILYEASKKTVVKVSLIYICQMITEDLVNDTTHTAPIPFRSSSFTSNTESKLVLSNKIKKAFKQQENAMEEYCNNGSNWKFDRSIAFDIEITGVRPIVIGGSNSDDTSSSYEDSQDEDSQYDDSENDTSQDEDQNDGECILKIANKKWLYDPKNKDKKCFLRCLHYGLNKTENFKSWMRSLNLKGLTFPISISQIKKFVRQNPHLDLKVNILFRNMEKQIFPYECGIGNGTTIINLLLIHVKHDNGKLHLQNHFLLIKNVNKYLASRYTRNVKGTYSYEKSYFCLNCLNKFSEENLLFKHEQLCHQSKGIYERTKPSYEKLKFKNHHHVHMQDFIAFLDFECILKPEENRCLSCSSLRCKCEKSFTEVVNSQEPFAYSFVILESESNQIIHQHTYAGENAATNFVDHLLTCEDEWITNLLNIKKPMELSHDEQLNFEKTENCYMCNINFQFKEDIVKCRDHNHYTGRYLGAACQRCNLKRRKYKKIPIFLHNGSKYDFHFIIQALSNKNVLDIDVLPYNGEHFRTISFNSFKFLDSLAFLQSSLNQLSEDLSKTNHHYPILKQTGLIKTNNIFDQNKLNCLLKKSFFPYEFCTSLELLEKTTAIPPRESFYSVLHETTISQEDYNFACKIWKMFRCKNLVDYTKIYCKLDTILLAEIFQKFRKEMHGFSGLDPTWYASLPGFAFDSMLKETRCSLEYLTDINMVHFFEAGIRGGVSFINNRYLKADAKKNEALVYIDANVSILLYKYHFTFT